MPSKRLIHSMRGALAIAAIAALTPTARTAGKTEVIHSFGEDDGEYPATDLVMDGQGALYGTTTEGGDFGSGTVFKLTPTDHGWIESILYSFTSAADGGQPYNGVTLDAQGNLYGTAVAGGDVNACDGGCGVVYKLTNEAGTWTQKVIYTFSGGNDGYGPGAGLTFDASGKLYGMTPTGGEFGLGVIYQLSPGPNDTWQFRVIHAFTGGLDGATGSAGRMLLHGGSFYGAATVGGANGKGTIFRLSPTQGGGWKLRTLYAFKGQPDGALPYGALTRDAAGNLYGTTYYEGAYGYGTVYQLSPNADEWTEKVLYSFRGGAGGNSPISHLNLDASGALYGTTSEGGAPGCSCGTIFKLTPSDGRWRYSVQHAFRGAPDGAYAYNGMVAGPNGTYYGSTVIGGGDDDGVVYEFKP